MRNKVAKRIKKDVALSTIGEPAQVTRRLYRQLKRQHTAGIKQVGEKSIDQIASLKLG